jgi:hypothetical protein
LSMWIVPDSTCTTNLLILSRLCSSKPIYIAFINSVLSSENALLLSYKDQVVRLVWERNGLPVLRKRKHT